jgi:hypothetical protein
MITEDGAGQVFASFYGGIMSIDLREEVRVILASESVYFGGMHLRYQLFARGMENVRTYWIGVRMGEERSEAFLGGSVG